MNQLRKDQAGFTLVEMTVTLILLSVVGLTVTNFIARWLQQSSLAQSRTALLQTAQSALDSVNDDVRLSGSADAVNRWPDANGPNNNQFGWASSSSVLVLARVAVDKSNNIIFSDQAKYISQKDAIIYYRTGTTLYRRVISSGATNVASISTCPAAKKTATCPADRIIATGITNFAATYYDVNNDVVAPDDARSVQLAITAERKLNNKTVAANYATRMVFRND